MLSVSMEHSEGAALNGGAYQPTRDRIAASVTLNVASTDDPGL